MEYIFLFFHRHLLYSRVYIFMFNVVKYTRKNSKKREERGRKKEEEEK